MRKQHRDCWSRCNRCESNKYLMHSLFYSRRWAPFPFIDIPLPVTRDLNFESQILFEIHKHPFHLQKSEPVKAEGIKFRDCLFAFLRLEREGHPTQALFQFSFKQSRNHPLSLTLKIPFCPGTPAKVGRTGFGWNLYNSHVLCVVSKAGNK